MTERPKNLATLLLQVGYRDEAQNVLFPLGASQPEISWKELHEKMTSVAHHLSIRGIKNLAMGIEPSHTELFFLFGAICAGAKILLLDPRSSTQELSQKAQEAGSQMILLDSSQKAREVSDKIEGKGPLQTVTREEPSPGQISIDDFLCTPETNLEDLFQKVPSIESEDPVLGFSIPEKAEILWYSHDDALSAILKASTSLSLSPRDVSLPLIGIQSPMDSVVAILATVLRSGKVVMPSSHFSLLENLLKASPSFLVFNEEVLRELQESLEQEFSAKNRLASGIYKKGTSGSKNMFARTFYDRFLFRKIRKAMGGQVSRALLDESVGENSRAFFAKIGIPVWTASSTLLPGKFSIEKNASLS